jgi:hypothetical protein
VTVVNVVNVSVVRASPVSAAHSLPGAVRAFGKSSPGATPAESRAIRSDPSWLNGNGFSRCTRLMPRYCPRPWVGNYFRPRRGIPLTKTSQARLEAWDASLNSPPPKSAQDQPNCGVGGVPMARMGYCGKPESCRVVSKPKGLHSQTCHRYFCRRDGLWWGRRHRQRRENRRRPAGSYTITLTATSALPQLSHTAIMTVTVQ